jgi:hypothetical protein
MDRLHGGISRETIPWDIPWYSVGPTESPPLAREVPRGLSVGLAEYL